ncbi:MAG: HDOD domain-containing protein [Ignavibacteriales bacterium]
MPRLSLDKIVSEVNDLPALPHVTYQVIKLVDDPESTAEDINNVVIQDQSLTARVLRLANSAHYGFPRRISTVTEATVLLGFNTIKGIVMAASVNEMMVKEITGYALAPGELWRHSQAAAIASRYIARQVKFPQPDVAYIGGLLHDIGKVVLNHHVKGVYHEVVELTNTGLPFLDAEREILGFTHPEVGSRVAEKWNLPKDLVQAIAHHHAPQDAVGNEKITSIVHIADAMCLMMGIGIGMDGLSYNISEAALQVLGQSLGNADQIISNLVDVLSDQNSFLG